MKKHKTEILLILFAGIILCWVGFLNNFPLVYSDTEDYLGGALGHYLPVDRPVFYGLFIRIAGLNSSLWLPILVQGILMSYLIFETVSIFYTGNKRNVFFIAMVSVLSACTGISGNVSILLPDIFSPIGVLCLVNLLLNNNLSKVRRVVISLILILCVVIHYSNLLAFIILFIMLAGYVVVKTKIKKQQTAFKAKRIFLCGSLLLSFFVITPTLNYWFGKKFVISEATHVFLINHLLETGILEDYLNNECAHNNYKICQYKDNLDTNFIWSSNSAFAKMGGWYDTKDEFNHIIVDILTTPKYEVKVLQRFTEYTFMQYFFFDIPRNKPYKVPFYVQKGPYKIYGRDYCASMQYNSWLDLGAINEIQHTLVLLGLGLLLVVLLIPALSSKISIQLKWVTLLILVYTVVNAAVCANFSTINLRFQDRIIWLIPFVGFIIVEHLVSDYCTKKRQMK